MKWVWQVGGANLVPQHRGSGSRVYRSALHNRELLQCYCKNDSAMEEMRDRGRSDLKEAGIHICTYVTRYMKTRLVTQKKIFELWI